MVGFDVTPEVTQDFTDNTESLSHGVRSLRPGGGTAMFDALYFACRDKLLKTHPGGLVRRAIILLSDGDDNQSHVTREEAIDMARPRRSDCLHHQHQCDRQPGHRATKCCNASPTRPAGALSFPFSSPTLPPTFTEIQEELRSQYMLSYTPADFTPDGSFHTIDVTAKNHKNLKVRSRRGYYAPTQ